MSSVALQTTSPTCHEPADWTRPLLDSPAIPYSSSPSSSNIINIHSNNYNSYMSNHNTHNNNNIPPSPKSSRRPSANSIGSGTTTPAAQPSAQPFHVPGQQHLQPHTMLATTAATAAATQPLSASSTSRPIGGDRKTMPPQIVPPRSSSQAQNHAPRRDNPRSSSANGRYEEPSRRHARGSSSGQDAAASQRSSSRQRESSTAPVRPHSSRPSTTASSKNSPSSRAEHQQHQQQQHQQQHATAAGHGRFPDIVSAEGAQGASVPQQPPQQQHAQPPQEGRRRRHDPNRSERMSRLGDYVMGHTIGEGEFGKVKLAWRQSDGGAGKQYAIKLIKKDILGENPNRLAKIWREVAILKRVSHPNIVRLMDTQDRDRYIGIILEYASGGELFDFILSQRCLKENVARRLFAQLVSGVGYLHKKGIVHRDLKLENLLLDSNRNIIITDFGFANTFDPDESLTEEEEHNLTDKEWVKKAGLDLIKKNGSRKGDLMQTSCGSPCYAAPELVISDSLYTGRKVDVWSCGVILYAMLAGYLPFDDDPANPEGDNINLLYRYIVSTPLTFPEPVGPGARDLLRRILVPNPRKRADLFEVARHSWLSEFADVVEFITSSSTSPKDIQNSTVPAEELADIPLVTRSTSVRETAASARSKAASLLLAGSKHAYLDPEEEAAYVKQQKDAKRRTVQVEYVAPHTQTRRGEDHHASSSSSSSSPLMAAAAPTTTTTTTPIVTNAAATATTSRSRAGRPSIDVTTHGRQSMEKPLPEPPASREGQRSRDGQRNRDGRRPVGSSSRFSNRGAVGPARFPTRTMTNGSVQSVAIGQIPQSQPAPPEVAGTVAHGSIQRPSRQYDDNDARELRDDIGADNGSRRAESRSSGIVPTKFAKVAGFDSGEADGADGAANRRSNTLSDLSRNLLGRSGSLFGTGRGRRSRAEAKEARKYPPVSMTHAMPSGGGVIGGGVTMGNGNGSVGGGEHSIRQSMESRMSRRSLSLPFGKKRSGSFVGSQHSGDRRRFSFLPHSFSAMIGLSGSSREPESPSIGNSQQDLPIQDPAEGLQQQQQQQQQQQYTTAPTPSSSHGEGSIPSRSRQQQQQQSRMASARVVEGSSLGAPRISLSTPTSPALMMQQRPSMHAERRPVVSSPLLGLGLGNMFGKQSESSFVENDSNTNNNNNNINNNNNNNNNMNNNINNNNYGMANGHLRHTPTPVMPLYEHESELDRDNSPVGKTGMLQQHKRFSEAYDDHGRGFGATRRVMAWFRARGRERAGEAR